LGNNQNGGFLSKTALFIEKMGNSVELPYLIVILKSEGQACRH
jgi:hypothetical protein